MLPGVNGSARTRTPSASATALPIAAAVGPVAASPDPTGGRSGRSKQHHVDRRSLIEGEDRVLLPRSARDLPAVEVHLLQRRPAHGLERAALDLVDDAVRIHDESDVDGDRSDG